MRDSLPINWDYNPKYQFNKHEKRIRKTHHRVYNRLFSVMGLLIDAGGPLISS